jgi:hypothetical protein
VRQKTADRAANKKPGKTPEPTAVLFDMFVSQENKTTPRLNSKAIAQPNNTLNPGEFFICVTTIKQK